MYLAPLPATLDVTLELAKRARVEYVVALSGEAHWQAHADAIAASGLVHTQLGPGEFLDNFAVWAPHTETVAWKAAETALVLCDVWNHHTCRGAEVRLERLIPRMAAVVQALRRKGVLIVHAPSNTMDFYAGTPARERVLEATPVAPPADLERDDPPLPIDRGRGRQAAIAVTASWI